MAKIAILEGCLAKKNTELVKHETVIAEKETVIQEQGVAISNLKADYNAAKFELDQLRRMIYGSKRERFISTMDATQMSIEFEPKTVEIEEAVTEEREKIRVSYLRNKPKKKHPGRMKLPDNLPLEETIVEPTEDTTGMVCIGRNVTEELGYTPARLFIKRTICPIYITKEDEMGNQKQVVAQLDRPIPKCIASISLLAMIFIDKYVYHLPLHRILKRILQLGVRVPSSTFESWVKLGAELIKPLYAVHRLHVFREIYQMIDESPIKVQDGDKPGRCHQGYMWVRYAPLSRSSLFEYYPSRSTQGPIDDLSTFKGYVQTDGYAGYTYLASLQGITHLSCWAHARRYFDKALKNDHERASHVMKLIQVLYAIEALAREANMSHKERYELRMEKSLPVINEIGIYIHKNKSQVTPKSPIGVAFGYCANRWTSLQNYLTDGMLEIDSNLVENSIRPLALGRKNYLFAGSHEAAKNIAMFYSFFATCAKNDIEPQKWLTYVMENINDTKSSKLKELLPQFIDKNLLD